MSDETVAQAFDPFFTRKENKNGIGLTIAWEKALQFGGDLILHSIEGLGTEVRILLPLYKNDASASELLDEDAAGQIITRRHVLEGFVGSVPGQPTRDN